MTEVVIAGAAVQPFGKDHDRSAAEIGGAAVHDLLLSVGLRPDQVEAGFVGSVYGGSLISQRVLQGGAISGQPVFTIENACASGGSAVHLAWQAVKAGVYECVVAVGVDRLSVFGGGALPLTTSDAETAQGMIMPSTYAMRAQRYLYESGATSQVLDAVSVKNRRNGADNPRGDFHKAVTSEEGGNITTRLGPSPLTPLHTEQ